MTWFKPPLYKRGNKKCPHCGNNQGWLQRPVFYWNSWKCSYCQSVLKTESHRTYAAMLAYLLALLTVTLVFILWFSSLSNWIPMLPSSALLVSQALNYWWLESVTLKDETAGSPVTSEKPSRII